MMFLRIFVAIPGTLRLTGVLTKLHIQALLQVYLFNRLLQLLRAFLKSMAR